LPAKNLQTAPKAARRAATPNSVGLNKNCLKHNPDYQKEILKARGLWINRIKGNVCWYESHSHRLLTLSSIHRLLVLGKNQSKRTRELPAPAEAIAMVPSCD